MSLPVTAASDVFSLGGTLYLAATGRHAFGGEGDYEVLVAVCTRDADLNSVPEPVRSVIADCLRKDPAERPTAAQLDTRFGELLEGFLGLKVELAGDGTRVAAYTDAGFERFTATELSAR
ncbi:hypothetical protein ACFY5F_46385 [Streptomyces sp. NPDC013161]|uniref:hypothetical protein n=1 Tax=Streptomyces sp. NPDC013161 TaxID=3364862 RepID=UPI0036ADF056